ncbi:hypothetical protein WMO79_01340 [Micrococcaceae bacterium Sec7.4]
MNGSTAQPEWVAAYETERTEARAKGMVRGRFVTEWVDEIKQMIRASRDDEALALLLECIDASHRAMADHGGLGGPWYTTAAAGIYRRRKDHQSEVAVLTSYLATTDGTGFSTMRAALRKAEAHLESSREAALPASCPACGSVWDTWPSARVTCPECGAGVVVVRKINGYPKMLTISQDAARQETATHDREREKMRTRVGYLGVNEAAWDAKCRLMPDGTMREVYLQLGNEAVVAADAAGNFALAHTYLWEMAKLEAESGRPWVELMQAAEGRMSTHLWSRYPPEQDMVIMGCSCGGCLPRSGRVTVAEYLEERPLPHSACSRPPCRCVLQPVPA